MRHTEARAIIKDAWRSVFGREGTLSELQLAQAVGWIETAYGRAWKPPGQNSKNWGAVHAGASWKGPTFSYKESHPNENGISVPYMAGFRIYVSDLEGAADMIKRITSGGLLKRRAKDHPWDPPQHIAAACAHTANVRVAIVRPAMAAGDAYAFSEAMYWSVYYEGFGKDPSTRISHHYDAIKKTVIAQCNALHEPPDALEACLTGEELDAIEKGAA